MAEATAAGKGRTGRHLLTVLAGGAALAALAVRRARLAAGASTIWALLTAEFALERILPGPRSRREIGTMLITSAAIPRWPSGTDSAGRSPSDEPIGNRLRIGPKPFCSTGTEP